MENFILSIKNKSEDEGTPYIIKINNSVNEEGNYYCEIIDDFSVSIFEISNSDYNFVINSLREKLFTLGKIFIPAGSIKKLDTETKLILENLVGFNNHLKMKKLEDLNEVITKVETLANHLNEEK